VLQSQLEECLGVVGAILLSLNTDRDRVRTQTRVVAVVDGGIVKAGSELVDQILHFGIVVILRADVEETIDHAMVVVDQVRWLNTGAGTASQVNFDCQKSDHRKIRTKLGRRGDVRREASCRKMQEREGASGRNCSI